MSPQSSELSSTDNPSVQVAIVSPAYALQEASKAQSSESWSSKIWDTLLVIDGALNVAKPFLSASPKMS